MGYRLFDQAINEVGKIADFGLKYGKGFWQHYTAKQTMHSVGESFDKLLATSGSLWY